jgi:TetR/AcrR family transcriptional regulator
MESKTEKHIKEVAKGIFFKEGRFDARLHEIADAASVNKALLHYYFRDREKLMQTVYEEALGASFLTMFSLLTDAGPFEKKVETALNHMTTFLSEYPFIESFIVSQVNAAGAMRGKLLPVLAAKKFMKQFSPEVRAYLRKKQIRDVTPEQFIVNMMALCAYPASTKPVIMGIFSYSEKQFSKFLQDRKKQVLGLILMTDKKAGSTRRTGSQA